MDTTMTSTKVHILPDGRMRPRDTAEYVGISPKTLAIWRSMGVGPPFIKVGYRGGRVFYYKNDLDTWINRTGRTQITANVQRQRKRGITPYANDLC